MPTEENWALHGGTPACDLCHSRKVKCDRQHPCRNCTTAGVPCLRTRQKKTPHPRVNTDGKIKALVDKLATLENAVRTTGVGARSASSAPPSTSAKSNTMSSTGDDISPRPAKRSRNDAGSIGMATSTPDLLSPPDPVAFQLHRNGGAREHIEKELTLNESLKTHQKSVFETAIAFIDQLSQGPTTSVEEEEIWNRNVSTDFSKGELVQIVLASPQSDANSNRPDMQLLTLDHIPPQALSRMATCLLEGTASEQTLNLCKVIVHFKAALGLYASQLHSPKNPTIREHVKEMQLRHLNAALAALDSVSIMARPSLLLLQALLTGSILMYIVGNSQSCWSLAAYASRTLVALGYHNIHTLTPNNEQNQEIRAAVAWCYHFDRSMSLLLLRPSSLPPLQISVASLVSYSPENPMAIFALIMLELVPIHEKVLDLTLAGQKRKMSKAEAEHEVDDLCRKMDEIYSTIEKARANSPLPHSPDYQLHWHSLEFKFFSMLTAVHHLSNTVCLCVSERERCLNAARRALQCVKSIQALAKQQDHFLEEYSPYLAWTILSYPLSPFFVLFCNVVGTSNVRDFQLLQDVVDSVSSLVIENKYVERLRRLCNTLLALCRPLVQQHGGAAIVQEQQAGLLLNFASGNDAAAVEDGMMPSQLAGETQEEELATESWQDDMMWQLLQAQPSLDWFNSDILDPAAWDLNTTS
ncbi:hypothetical protein P171DRAFT_202687 [Karstenula rhodostoma CBS 690.94]|uniref:Zn(2)-C6 fungal-type domain-containing protein n=1 Tax=Karstenula rhodostoma CBS 690.94 TaxID=1392251 RepID=A0A9P4PTI3_9PLEO|nr:hypothetical protein P171DRAFT_202687 [Karstenula rhodostoma CBS 690.94]